MSLEQLFEAQTQLVRPSGEVLIARVTPKWQVEIGPKGLVEKMYGPEEALCLFALAKHIDEPMKIPELGLRVLEIGRLARDLGAKPNPMIDDGQVDDEFNNLVLEAFGKLIIEPYSHFRENAMFLGAGAERRLWLLADTSDENYGKRKLEDFFADNTELDDPNARVTSESLHKAYLGSFGRDIRSMHNALGIQE